MTDLDEQFAPPVLPGAARALSFAEPTEEPERPRPVDKTEAAATQEEVRPAAPQVALNYRPAPIAEPPAQFGKRRHVVRILSFGLAKPKPGRQEQEYRDNNRMIKEASWPHSVHIVVANPKGGVAKTPTALLLGGVLASQRGGSVAVWDACDSAGTLHSRAGGHQARCVSEIVPNADQLRDTASIAAFMATQSSFADVLGSLREGREFDDVAVNTVTKVLDRTHRIQVADTANTPHSYAYREALRLADVLVVPSTLTADSVNKALELLRRVQAEGPLGQRAVVVLNHFGGPVTVAEAHELFATVGVGAVVDVPFDQHIIAGTEIDFTKLTHESKLAWTRVGATVVANIVQSSI